MVGLRRDAKQRFIPHTPRDGAEVVFPGLTRSENECGFRSRFGAFAT